MVWPLAPLKPIKVTLPVKIEYIFVPCGAGISIPVWNEDAPEVGLFLFPKYDVIFEKPGIGQKKLSVIWLE